VKRVLVTGASGYLGSRLVPALVALGYEVRGLARSSRARDAVLERGAEPVDGDIADVASLERAMSGCDAVVHAAGKMGLHGPYAEFHAVNVVGTENVLAAARRSESVRRMIYVGAAASVMGDEPVDGADESWPLHQLAYSPYPATKTLADIAVRAANGPELETCVLRPGWIWGVGDPISARMADAARKGRMMLIDGGTHRLVTSHVDNVCHALGLALSRGGGGSAYFVFDDEAVVLRDWVAQLFAAQGVSAVLKSISYRKAWMMASLMELAWRLFRRPGSPPIVRALVRLQGRQFVVSDRRARAELGYAPKVSRAAGLAALTESLGPRLTHA
jgi:nucleoside-diphosphate-sugar epimerase